MCAHCVPVFPLACGNGRSVGLNSIPRHTHHAPYLLLFAGQCLIVEDDRGGQVYCLFMCSQDASLASFQGTAPLSLTPIELSFTA